MGSYVRTFLSFSSSGPFPVGDMDQPLSNGPFPLGDMDRPLSNWVYELIPFRLGVWTGPFLAGDMDWPLSTWVGTCEMLFSIPST